jgi:hypothetical protein
MDKQVQQHLGITQRSDDELRDTIHRFQAKWNAKAKRSLEG